VASLCRAAEAARPSGRVVVMGGVNAENESRRLMVETVLLGGTTRTRPEFAKLARQAGLEVAAAMPRASRLVVECRPVGGGT
jgi:hypothetical protein